jgi:ubiquinone/menaquinone biosynthesis C-methylase UbiE
MKLNRLEFLLMNNPLRRAVQQRFEIRVLRALSPRRPIASALEIGCGSAHGARLIREHFAPRRLAAVDLDPAMIRRAARRSRGAGIGFAVMDAGCLGFPAAAFDAVFDFGALHHMADWRGCLAELNRVLVPGGMLFLEEISIEFFRAAPGRWLRPLLAHPYAAMFSRPELLDGLDRQPFGLFGLFSLAAVRR